MAEDKTFNTGGVYLPNLIIKCANGEEYSDDFEFVPKFYVSDIKEHLLKSQLLTFHTNFPREEHVNLNNIIEFMKRPGMTQLLSEISIILKLILVLPATNATPERMFSNLRHVKDYMRTTTTQPRLNHLMVLKIYKEQTDNLSLPKIGQEFVNSNERRLTIFGKFIK